MVGVSWHEQKEFFVLCLEPKEGIITLTQLKDVLSADGKPVFPLEQITFTLLLTSSRDLS